MSSVRKKDDVGETRMISHGGMGTGILGNIVPPKGLHVFATLAEAGPLSGLDGIEILSQAVLSEFIQQCVKAVA